MADREKIGEISVYKYFGLQALKHLKLKSIIKKRLQHSYFPMNIIKFLKTPILKNICE